MNHGIVYPHTLCPLNHNVWWYAFWTWYSEQHIKIVETLEWQKNKEQSQDVHTYQPHPKWNHWRLLDVFVSLAVHFLHHHLPGMTPQQIKQWVIWKTYDFLYRERKSVFWLRNKIMGGKLQTYTHFSAEGNENILRGCRSTVRSPMKIMYDSHHLQNLNPLLLVLHLAPRHCLWYCLHHCQHHQLHWLHHHGQSQPRMKAKLWVE